jgi:N-acyl-D-aspartate/D-glutamate deacylase
MHDLVIRGGTVVDSTGDPARTADVAVSDGVITDVGLVDGPARRVIVGDRLRWIMERDDGPSDVPAPAGYERALAISS